MSLLTSVRRGAVACLAVVLVALTLAAQTVNVPITASPAEGLTSFNLTVHFNDAVVSASDINLTTATTGWSFSVTMSFTSVLPFATRWTT